MEAQGWAESLRRIKCIVSVTSYGFVLLSTASTSMKRPVATRMRFFLVSLGMLRCELVSGEAENNHALAISIALGNAIRFSDLGAED